MPWCDACDEYRAPNALAEDGSCAACGGKVDTSDLKHPPSTKAPWHFWLMVIALVLYLGWRLIQGIIWVVQKM
ncbi:MAG: hypothetical protein R2710_22520 [Acidimicrobiales bacterium]